MAVGHEGTFLRRMVRHAGCGIAGSSIVYPEQLADGSPFPQRNLILFITFVVILVTLVGQGLTLRLFHKKDAHPARW